MLMGHEYDEFVRAAKLDNEPEIYTAYGESAIVSILMFNELKSGGPTSHTSFVKHFFFLPFLSCLPNSLM
ncbi:hypothetical protein HN873_007334 [Arachis hypogaea]